MSDAAKKRLHELVDALPTGEALAAERYLEYLRDRGEAVRATLASAPEDDEDAHWDETEAAQGRADAAAGRTLTTEELERELGLE